MLSPRVLGVVALAAIVVAAVSFAVVDVTVDDGCSSGACVAGIPSVALGFTALGAAAALGSVVPTITWIVEAVRSSHMRSAEHARELELVRAGRLRSSYAEDDL